MSILKKFIKTKLMQYIEPSLCEKPTLAPDGCLYLYQNDHWEKVFEYNGWVDHVKATYQNYLNGLITLTNLLDRLTTKTHYCETSGYQGEMKIDYFGSCQYYSIYQMYLFMLIPDYCGIDNSAFLGKTLSKFIPKPNYGKILISLIRANELECIGLDDDVCVKMCVSPHGNFFWKLMTICLIEQILKQLVR